jgi:hypothetical protein
VIAPHTVKSRHSTRPASARIRQGRVQARRLLMLLFAGPEPGGGLDVGRRERRGSWAAVALLAASCGGGECEPWEQRCSDDGTVVERCVAERSCQDAYVVPCSEGGVWERIPCRSPYDRCELFPTYGRDIAGCYGELGAACELEPSPDACVDERTLVQCTVTGCASDGGCDAREETLRCAEGTTCQEIPDGARRDRGGNVYPADAAWGLYRHQCGAP